MENLQTDRKDIGIPVGDRKTFPLLPIRGVVLLPQEVLNIDIVRGKSRSAVEYALANGGEIFLSAQKDSATANPAPSDIYSVGTLGKITYVSDSTKDYRITVTGIKRMRIDEYFHSEPFFVVYTEDYPTENGDELKLEAFKRMFPALIKRFQMFEGKIPAFIFSALANSEYGKFIASLAPTVYRNDTELQELLQMPTYCDQMESLYKHFDREAQIAEIERTIALAVRKNIDKGQREYYLREQMKVIKKELGEDENEIEQFRKQMAEKHLPDYVKEQLNKELSRMEKMNPTSPEAGVIRGYAEWILDLPWTETDAEDFDIARAREILDEDHYGLEKVKERILEFLAVRKLTKGGKAPILCFVGPPGVGKTSIVYSIARAAGKKLVTMSLGGVRDEAEIRGHRRTYIGSMPGRIISAMRNAGVTNPVFLLDEVDKMSSDFRGDPASALLEVLDPNQNFNFKDHFLEVPYDLSKVLFVMTANTLDTIAPPLLDRMEVIELSGYTYEEKLEIAKRYLLPKQLKQNGLADEQVDISDDALYKIIYGYTRESGVRNLEREIGAVARKIAVKVVGGEQGPFSVGENDVEQYLEAVKYSPDEIRTADEVGLATGLAWTSVGGVTLSIEVALLPGKGEIQLTGSLGEVMKESCQTALSVIKSRADKYGIDAQKFTEYGIHIHFPEGATPKDGPSAGITVATALLSALSGRKVKSSVAMTGEITLRGKVLAIGGLKEKSLAAYRAGIKTLILPEENRKDEKELPREVKAAIDVVYTDDIDKVFDIALCE